MVRENERILRKICPDSESFTTNPTWSDKDANSRLQRWTTSAVNRSETEPPIIIIIIIVVQICCNICYGGYCFSVHTFHWVYLNRCLLLPFLFSLYLALHLFHFFPVVLLSFMWPHSRIFLGHISSSILLLCPNHLDIFISILSIIVCLKLAILLISFEDNRGKRRKLSFIHLPHQQI